MYSKSRRTFVVWIFVALFFLVLNGCTSYLPSQFVSSQVSPPSPAGSQIPVVEKKFSDHAGTISIGIANKINRVSLTDAESIEENKRKMLELIDVFKQYKVNMVLFPEFSLTGYFWKDSPECWDYMRKGVTNAHMEWVAELKSRLDDTLQYIVFNNIRLNPKDPDGKFLNSTYVVDKNFDCTDLDAQSNEQFHIYDKTFLPGIENTFTQSGRTDVLVLETKWGRFGFATCYDMCFTQLFQEYAMFNKVDAMIQVASWRGTSTRDYPGMGVHSDHYYGFIWDLMTAGQAAFNQVWLIASNAVGTQQTGDYTFWGGSGLWAPSGMKLIEASNSGEELIVVHNVDIKGQVTYEHDDFFYYDDFIKIYEPIPPLRTFTRMEQ